MPAYFWAEAVRTAVYVLNRAPTRSLEGVTPYEAWHGRKPSVQHLRTFGCTVHVKSVGPGISKLSDRLTPMVFVGYEDGSKAYRIYDPTASKVRVTRATIFEENRPWVWRTPGAATDAPALATFTVVYTTDRGVHELDTEGCTRRTPRSGEDMPATPTLGTPSPNAGTLQPDSASPGIAGAIRWATPLSGDEERRGTDFGPHFGPHRYRLISDVLDETEGEAVRENMERCLLSTEDPHNMGEAMDDAAWKAAMDEVISA